MAENNYETLTLKQQRNFQCSVEFGEDIPTLVVDEPSPLGEGLGPTPVQLLLAAVANCLTDSLLFALRKFKQNGEPLACAAKAEVGRNSENRLRVLSIEAEITLGQESSSIVHLERILDQFEGFCTVTRSVAQGVPVRLFVKDSEGVLLKQPLN